MQQLLGGQRIVAPGIHEARLQLRRAREQLGRLLPFTGVDLRLRETVQRVDAVGIGIEGLLVEVDRVPEAVERDQPVAGGHVDAHVGRIDLEGARAERVRRRLLATQVGDRGALREHLLVVRVHVERLVERRRAVLEPPVVDELDAALEQRRHAVGIGRERTVEERLGLGRIEQVVRAADAVHQDEGLLDLAVGLEDLLQRILAARRLRPLAIDLEVHLAVEDARFGGLRIQPHGFAEERVGLLDRRAPAEVEMRAGEPGEVVGLANRPGPRVVDDPLPDLARLVVAPAIGEELAQHAARAEAAALGELAQDRLGAVELATPQQGAGEDRAGLRVLPLGVAERVERRDDVVVAAPAQVDPHQAEAGAAHGFRRGGIRRPLRILVVEHHLVQDRARTRDLPVLQMPLGGLHVLEIDVVLRVEPRERAKDQWDPEGEPGDRSAHVVHYGPPRPAAEWTNRKSADRLDPLKVCRSRAPASAVATHRVRGGAPLPPSCRPLPDRRRFGAARAGDTARRIPVTDLAGLHWIRVGRNRGLPRIPEPLPRSPVPMKLLLAVLAVGIVAAPYAVSQETKIPREPSVGQPEKLPAPPVPGKGSPQLPVDQPVADTPRPVPDAEKPVVAATRKGLATVFDDPDLVMFDRPDTDGPLWAGGVHFKASFDTQGWTFIDQPLKDAEQLEPIRFDVRSIRLGGEALAIDSKPPVQREHVVVLEHGSMTEAVEVRGSGVEQTFTFDRLPKRGELVVDLGVTTRLTAETVADGIRFHGPFDDVHYSNAVAIDAAGERTAVATELTDGHILLRVPASFVEHATLPLVIDPTVAWRLVYNGVSNDVASPDVAWDVNGSTWNVTFTRHFGGSDWDCYVQRLDANLNLVGGLTTIDVSTNQWQFARIADLEVYSVLMVVAQVRTGSGVWRVSGRIMANSGPTTTGQFDIATSGVDEIHPDVGGDPYLGPPVYFAVVWEHSYSATDHDIYARQVWQDGSLRGSGPTYVQTNTSNQTNPSISKSDGAGPVSTQRYTIVYQQTFTVTDEDIYGAMLTWDGVIVPVNGSNTFVIDFSGYDDFIPQASSPSLADGTGRRRILAVYERVNLNAGDIVGTCIDQNGVRLAQVNITSLELDANRQSWPQHAPSVDCDGLRFGVAYHEVYGGNTTTNDLDTRMDIVVVGTAGIQLEEYAQPMGFSQDREFNANVASRYSGTATFSTHFCEVNDRDGVAGGFGIDAYTFDEGPGSVFQTRATACGSLTIQHTGLTLLGTNIGVQLNSGSAPAGFLIGAPANTSLAGICPCTLGVGAGTSVSGSAYALYIPVDPQLIGVILSFQGFSVQSPGPCLGSIRLSDTVDVTIQ